MKDPNPTTYAKENYLQPDANIKSGFWAKNITGVLIEQYKSHMVGSVVDFGCNNGVHTAKVSCLDTVDKVVGFDLNQEALDQATKVVKPQVPDPDKLEFVATNLTNIAWEDASFDFAFSFHTLEHIFPEDVDACMSEMARVLKPGAHFLMNLPDKHSARWDSGHVYHPDLQELNDLFEKHGFTTVESYEDERGGQVGPSRNITGLYVKNATEE